MDVLKLRHEGFTINEIADELGYHPATISRWIKEGGPPQARDLDRSELVIDEHWSDRIHALLEANPRLLATSVTAIIAAEGFLGSYPTVSRHVRSLRGPRFRRADKASVPIETAPGEECQFDWSDCSDFGELFGLGELHCFGAILSWSRWRRWWFAPSIDQHHTLEGLAQFYEAAGGVPYFSRTDRMGALGSSTRPALCLAPGGARLRPAARDGPRRLPGTRRQAEGEDRAALQGPEGELLGRARARPADIYRRDQHPRRGLSHHKGPQPPCTRRPASHRQSASASRSR